MIYRSLIRISYLGVNYKCASSDVFLLTCTTIFHNLLAVISPPLTERENTEEDEKAK